MRSTTLRLLRCLLLPAILAHMPARAAEPNGEGPQDALQEIVVTGELIKRPLQESPTSTSVVSGDEVEQRGEVDLYDVVKDLPNVNSGSGDRGFSIRGINQFGASGTGSVGFAVTTIVDNVPLASGESQELGPFGAWDLDRIEVLRGPQSTQQGPNALAGAIIIQTHDPVLGVYEGSARFGVSSFVGNRESVMANLPFDGMAALRLDYDRTADHGYLFDPTIGGHDYAPDSTETYRAKFLLQPVDGVRVLATYSHVDNLRGYPVVDPGYGLSAREITSDVPAFIDDVTDIASLVVDWQAAPEWSVKSISSYLKASSVRMTDSDYSAQSEGDLRVDYMDRNYHQEARLNFSSSRLQAVGGVYYAHEEESGPAAGEFPTSLFFPGLSGTVTLNTNSPFTIQNWAVFGEAQWQVTDPLSITVGARYDDERQSNSSITEFAFNPPQSFSIPSSSSADSVSYHALLPKAAATWRFTSDMNASLSYQRGYRAGGYSTSLVSGAGGEYGPEYLDDFELAFRAEFFDRRLTWDSNLYRGNYRDQQVAVFGPTLTVNDTYTANAGRSLVEGFESSLAARPMSSLTLNASVGYARTEFLDFFDASVGENYHGNQFIYAPKWTSAIGGTWNFLPHLTVFADATYQSVSYSDEANSAALALPSRTLMNARLSYEDTFKELRWHVALYGRNLTDKSYPTQIYASGNAAVPYVDFIGQPRIIGLEAGGSF